MHKTHCVLIAIFSMFLISPVSAQQHSTSHMNDAASPMEGREAAISPEGVMTVGEVIRADARTDKLTIRHEAIRNLEMPAMTMVFALQGDAHARDFKPGDQVLFHAEEKMGVLSITRIQRIQ